MSNVDTRQGSRDSLFLLAMLKVEGDARDTQYRVKVRNLSARGMMAEGDVGVAPGSRVSVELRNIGWVDGAVAWKQENRFGIAFAREIDHDDVRERPGASDTAHETARFIRPAPGQNGARPASRGLRKL